MNDPRSIPDSGDERFFPPGPNEPDAPPQEGSQQLFTHIVIPIRSPGDAPAPAVWPEIPPEDLCERPGQPVDRLWAEPRTRLAFAGVRVAGSAAILAAVAVGAWLLRPHAALQMADQSLQVPPPAVTVGRNPGANAPAASSDSTVRLQAESPLARPSASIATSGQHPTSVSARDDARLPPARPLASASAAPASQRSPGPTGTSPPPAARAAASIPDRSASTIGAVLPDRAPQDIARPPVVESVAPEAGPVATVAPDVPGGVTATSAASAANAIPAASAGLALAAGVQGVRAVLNRYRDAYSTLDVNLARAVWPGVDARALARAFDRISMQQFEFAACDISITGERALAGCSGNARYVPKVGNKNPRVESRVWEFELRRIDQQWTIEAVASR
jgi:hypothetical protein